jgi:hypothetical protein
MEWEEAVTDAAAGEPRPITPVTDPVEMYALMTHLVFDWGYDKLNSDRVFDALWPKRRRRAVRWRNGWLRLTVARKRNGMKTYQAYHPNGRCLCSAVVSDVHYGVGIVEHMEMKWGAEPGVVGAVVLKAMRADLARLRAKLWPSPPTAMEDNEFLAWWGLEKDDITYYPHRERLGLTLTADEEDALDYNRHLLSYMRDKAVETGKGMQGIWNEISRGDGPAEDRAG